MTILVSITTIFLCILLVICIGLIVQTLVRAKRREADYEEVYVMFFSLIALAVISISFITFYKLIF